LKGAFFIVDNNSSLLYYETYPKKTQMKTGTANLPLHYGKAPRWLFLLMTKLAREISIVLIRERGVKEFLVKLSDPYWFQAFGCVLGFDWHSSGITTTTCGALKEGLKPLQKDIGLFIAGGKGATSRKTPEEIKNKSWFLKNKTDNLIYASRISAKVDNNALQDGYQLYHHNFFFTRGGDWAVVQQGMSSDKNGGWARRYHWLSDTVSDFVNEPHQGIATQKKSQKVLNLVAQKSNNARGVITKLSARKPEKNLKEAKSLKVLRLPPKHEVLVSDLHPDSLEKILLSTYERKPENFETLLGMRGVGPKTIRALALISELIYKTPYSTYDPAKYSFAHGGKDGTPYPVHRQTYSASIDFLRQAVKKAKIGHWQKLHALRRLC